MNIYLSKKLKTISSISMIMVVFLHSYNLLIKTLSGNIVIEKGYSFFIQNFISLGITRTAVPIFFAISGYLFFYKIDGKFNEFILKLKKRSYSLGLPYLFWSIWGLLIYLLLQNIPLSKTFFTNELISNYSTNKLITTIFFNPISYQLWFVRDLIVLIFLAPLIYWLTYYLNYFTIISFFITWYFDINFKILSNEAILFFAIGAYVSIKQKKLIFKKLSEKYCLTFTFLWITIVLCKTMLIFIDFNNQAILNLLHKVSILIGIISIWNIYDIFQKHENTDNQLLYIISSFSFFLYAFHEPILTVLKKGLFYIMGKGEFTSLCIYITAPLLTISFSIIIGYYLKKLTPKFYYIITGGR